MDRIDEAVEVAMAAYSAKGMEECGEGESYPAAMHAAILAGVKVLLGQARPAIMDVDSERVAIVDRHDDCPSHGFQNVWIVDAPSLGEGE